MTIPAFAAPRSNSFASPTDGMAQQSQISPFSSTSIMPDQTMFNMDGDGGPQFGESFMDTFDFSDLGFTPAPVADGSFNPFALAQNQPANGYVIHLRLCRSDSQGHAAN